jgi:hypothetical protein
MSNNLAEFDTKFARLQELRQARLASLKPATPAEPSEPGFGSELYAAPGELVKGLASGAYRYGVRNFAAPVEAAALAAGRVGEWAAGPNRVSNAAYGAADLLQTNEGIEIVSKALAPSQEAGFEPGFLANLSNPAYLVRTVAENAPELLEMVLTGGAAGKGAFRNALEQGEETMGLWFSAQRAAQRAAIEAGEEGAALATKLLGIEVLGGASEAIYQAATKAALFHSTIMAGAMGGKQQFFNTYAAAREFGVSESEAISSAITSGVVGAGLNALPFHFIFKSIPEGIKGRMLQALSSGGAAAFASETQALVDAGLLGQPIWDSMKYAWQAGGPMFVMMGLMGASQKFSRGGTGLDLQTKDYGILPANMAEADPNTVKQLELELQSAIDDEGGLENTVLAADAVKSVGNKVYTPDVPPKDVHDANGMLVKTIPRGQPDLPGTGGGDADVQTTKGVQGTPATGKPSVASAQPVRPANPGTTDVSPEDARRNAAALATHDRVKHQTAGKRRNISVAGGAPQSVGDLLTNVQTVEEQAKVGPKPGAGKPGPKIRMSTSRDRTLSARVRAHVKYYGGVDMSHLNMEDLAGAGARFTGKGLQARKGEGVAPDELLEIVRAEVPGAENLTAEDFAAMLTGTYRGRKGLEMSEATLSRKAEERAVREGWLDPETGKLTEAGIAKFAREKAEGNENRVESVDDLPENLSPGEQLPEDNTGFTLFQSTPTPKSPTEAHAARTTEFAAHPKVKAFASAAADIMSGKLSPLEAVLNLLRKKGKLTYERTVDAGGEDLITITPSVLPDDPNYKAYIIALTGVIAKNLDAVLDAHTDAVMKHPSTLDLDMHPKALVAEWEQSMAQSQWIEAIRKTIESQVSNMKMEKWEGKGQRHSGLVRKMAESMLRATPKEVKGVLQVLWARANTWAHLAPGRTAEDWFSTVWRSKQEIGGVQETPRGGAQAKVQHQGAPGQGDLFGEGVSRAPKAAEGTARWQTEFDLETGATKAPVPALWEMPLSQAIHTAFGRKTPPADNLTQFKKEWALSVTKAAERGDLVKPGHVTAAEAILKNSVAKPGVVQRLFDAADHIKFGVTTLFDDAKRMIDIYAHGDFSTIVHEYLSHIMADEFDVADRMTIAQFVNDLPKNKPQAARALAQKLGLAALPTGEQMLVPSDNQFRQAWSQQGAEVVTSILESFIGEGLDTRGFSNMPETVRGAFQSMHDQLKRFVGLYIKATDLDVSPAIRDAYTRLFVPSIRGNARAKMINAQLMAASHKFGLNPRALFLSSPESFRLMAKTLGYNLDTTKHGTVMEAFGRAKAILDDPAQREQFVKEILENKQSAVHAAGFNLLLQGDSMEMVRLLEGKKLTTAQLKQVMASYQGRVKQYAEYRSGSGAVLNMMKYAAHYATLMDTIESLDKQLSERDHNRIFQALDAFAKGEDGAGARMQEVYASLQPGHLKDMVAQVAYCGMLFRPATWGKNALMNSVGLAFLNVLRPAAGALDLGWHTLTGAQRNVFAGEVIPMWRSMFTNGEIKGGLSKGWDNAAYMVKNNKTPKGYYGYDKIELDVASHSMRALENSSSAMIRTLAPALSFSSRVLRATDLFFSTVAFEQHIAALTKRKSGKGVDKHWQNMSPETIRQEAAKWARHATFTDEPGAVGRHILGFKKSLGVDGIPFIPFVNTLINIVKRGVELTPVAGHALFLLDRSEFRSGPAKLARRKANAWAKENKVEVGSDRYLTKLQAELETAEVPAKRYESLQVEAIAKQIAGAVFAGTLIGMCHSGKMHGGLPASKAERELWQRLGRQPYSVDVFGYNVALSNLEPFSLPMTFAISTYERFFKGYDPSYTSGAEDMAWTKKFELFAKDMTQVLETSSFVGGMVEYLDPERGFVEKVSKYMGTYVPMSGLLRDIAKGYEQEKNAASGYKVFSRDADTLAAQLFRAVPFSGEVLGSNYRLNVYGEPVEVKTDSFFKNWLPFKVADTTESSPVDVEMDRLHETVGAELPSMPGKTRVMKENGPEVDIPMDVYRAHVAYLGPKLKEAYQRTMDSPAYLGAPQDFRGDSQRARMLKRSHNRVATVAEHKLMSEMRRMQRLGQLGRNLQ